jgi:hypothetical protein
MSFNANTIYKAVDVDKLAKECKDAITQDYVFVVVVYESMFGIVHSIYRSYAEAIVNCVKLNSLDPDHWTIEKHVVH